MMFIISWKVLGEFVSPKNMTSGSQCPNLVLNAAFHSSPFLIRTLFVTDLQGPPSERTPEQKLWDFKTRAQQYARDRESCDDVRISYLEFLETEAEDDLALARMIAG
jgi:hypothetical protein